MMPEPVETALSAVEAAQQMMAKAEENGLVLTQPDGTKVVPVENVVALLAGLLSEFEDTMKQIAQQLQDIDNS
jgi:hypothetical protein